jgi:hypothetical protein
VCERETERNRDMRERGIKGERNRDIESTLLTVTKHTYKRNECTDKLYLVIISAHNTLAQNREER